MSALGNNLFTVLIAWNFHPRRMRGLERMIEDDLAGHGYGVRWAHDTEEALAHLSSGEDIDAFAIDIDSPRVDASGLAAALRDADDAYRLPVLFISNWIDCSVEEHPLLRCLSYIIKPFNPSEIREHFLDKARANRKSTG